MKESYQNPEEWYQEHQQELREYVGEWIAYSKDGVVAHDRDYLTMISQVNLSPEEFTIEHIFASNFVEPAKFYPIRFRTLKSSNWQPTYPVTLKYQNQRRLRMLVDSGADFSLIPKQLGLDLGYQVGGQEVMARGEGVGGEVDYVLRNVEISIDDRSFMAPVAWLQTEHIVETLLGREVVFDLFDIEFKQSERQIIFKYRTQN
jgi:hypothetical protein